MQNLKVLRLLFHLSFGVPGVATMRFEGIINGVTVQILLDSGSSNSFMQPILAQFLNLPMQKALQFWVMVGNGNTLSTEGLIPKILVSI